MCFVVFCGVLRVFCAVLRVFCGVLRVFCSISTKHTEHLKNIENNTEKHKKLTIRSCIAGVFQDQKNSTVLHKTTFTKHLTSAKPAKHRKTPQNSRHNMHFVKLRRKTLQNFCKTHAKCSKTSQNAHNTAAIRIARIRCFPPKYARSVAKAHNTQYRRTSARNRRPILECKENSYECLPLRPNNHETTIEIHQGLSSQ